MPLTKFLYEIYALQKNLSASSVEQYRSCIRWLNAYLKAKDKYRDRSFLTDLRSENLSGCRKFIIRNGRRQDYAERIAKTLLTLWKFAASDGYLPPGREPRLPKLQQLGESSNRRTPADPSGFRLRPTIPGMAIGQESEASKTVPVQPWNIAPATPETPLEEFLYRHYAPARGLARGSLISGYNAAIVKLSRFLRRPAKLCDLNAATLNAFLTNELTTLRPATVHGYRTNLLTFWRFAANEGILSDFPRKVRPIKRPAVVIDGYDLEQVGRLLTAADAIQGKCHRTKIEKRIWFVTFILLAWSTGLRLGDVLSIANVLIQRQPDGSGRVGIVMQKTGRLINRLLPADAMAAVERCMAQGPRRTIVLAPWCDRSVFYREFKLIARAAGLGGSAKWLRRGSASAIEAIHPGSGSAHLGHSSPELFGRAYRCDRIVGSTIRLPPMPVFTPAICIEHKPHAGKAGAP
jgi:site-specific recombinase XerD